METMKIDDVEHATWAYNDDNGHGLALCGKRIGPQDIGPRLDEPLTCPVCKEMVAKGITEPPKEPQKVENKKRHPALVILGILLEGHQGVKVNGEEWWYQDGVFGLRRECWKGDVRQDDVLIGVDMSVGDFIRWCEKLPEETVIQAVFASVVAKERIKKF